MSEHLGRKEAWMHAVARGLPGGNRLALELLVRGEDHAVVVPGRDALGSRQRRHVHDEVDIQVFGSVDHAVCEHEPTFSIGVLTSTVRPLYIVRMSSCRNMSGPMPFSARQSTKCNGRPMPPHLAAVSQAPKSPAEPPMSRFIPHMPSRPFNAAPPVSKVMPLPTSATPGLPSAPAPSWVKTMSTGMAAALFPTFHIPP